MSLKTEQFSPPGGQEAGPIRVMLVDDSAVVRGLYFRLLDEDPEIKIVSSVANGLMAVKHLGHDSVDVVVLDIEMPVMGGLEALPKLLAIRPGLPVLVASSLTQLHAEVSLKALEAGAADILPKPTSIRDIGENGPFRREFLGKVKSLGLAFRLKRELGNDDARERTVPRPASVYRDRPGIRTALPEASPKVQTLSPLSATPILLRQPGQAKAEVLAIGSSTGGPQALFAFLRGLRGGCRLPVLVTQHMPATFTPILAQHIQRMSGWECREATDGLPVSPGQVLVAPGGYHMLVEQQDSQVVVRLNDGPEENYCRPSVDPMMRSIARVYGRHALGVILTGMGTDGLKGCMDLVSSGGTLLAQDEASCVVWGMPGAVAKAGICSAVLPLDELANQVIRLTTRGGR